MADTYIVTSYSMKIVEIKDWHATIKMMFESEDLLPIKMNGLSKHQQSFLQNFYDCENMPDFEC
jgi:hypothetical protein